MSSDVTTASAAVQQTENALAPSTSPMASPPPAVAVATAAATSEPQVTTLDLLDWKQCETKNGETFITFLFELRYVYPALSVAYAAAAGVSLPPVTVVSAKRFAELHSLHSLLERHFVCLPPFPNKTLTRRIDKEFVEQRCQALLAYLRQVLLREDIQRTGWLQKFMGVSSPAARVREARAQQLQHTHHQHHQQQQQDTVASQSTAHTQLSQSGGEEVESMPVSGSLAHVVEVSGLEDTSSAFDAEPQPDRPPQQQHEHEEEDESSEPATTSNSFTNHDAADEEEEDAYNSDDDFREQMRAGQTVESVAEAVRRRAEGSRVHSVRRSGSGPALSGHGLDAFLRDSTSGTLFAEVPPPALGPPPAPSTCALEFLSRSGVFDFLQTVLVDDHTLLALAADLRAVARVDSWLSGLFGGGGGARKNEREAQVAESVTFTSESHNSADSNPLGALYAFRRRPLSEASASSAGQEDFEESLRIFFSCQPTSLVWDADRRWIYVADARGGLSVFSPADTFDYAVKVVQASVFGAGASASVALDQDAPITHMQLVRTRRLPTGALLLCSAPNDAGLPQLVAVFDAAAQQLISAASFRFDLGANSHARVGAIAVCDESERMFVAAERAISVFDLSALPHAQPPLLHRLANGHAGPIRCLAWNPSAQLLASGGDDRAVVLWRIAPKHSERHTLLLSRLIAHESRVRCVSWSDEAASGLDRAPAFLASGDDTGHVCLWSPTKRACVLAFRAHESAVSQLQLTAQLALVTASHDRTTKMWQLA